MTPSSSTRPDPTHDDRSNNYEILTKSYEFKQRIHKFEHNRTLYASSRMRLLDRTQSQGHDGP